ncbi:hypothetical protein C2W64_04058 [Brevibacillus laterosporus]|nr:hypothetical protein [Brevibacillus laterosporus]RAP29111.1 hypothetical protein C2W64_04058 [Brevibacillus laterosporus]
MNEKLLKQILEELTIIKSTMATKDDVNEIKQKLDTIYTQVAHNTEQEANLNEATSKIEALETDIKLIKRVLTNQ